MCSVSHSPYLYRWSQLGCDGRILIPPHTVQSPIHSWIRSFTFVSKNFLKYAERNYIEFNFQNRLVSVVVQYDTASIPTQTHFPRTLHQNGGKKKMECRSWDILAICMNDRNHNIRKCLLSDICANGIRWRGNFWCLMPTFVKATNTCTAR